MANCHIYTRKYISVLFKFENFVTFAMLQISCFLSMAIRRKAIATYTCHNFTMASEAVTAALFPQVFEIGMILFDYDVKRTTRTYMIARQISRSPQSLFCPPSRLLTINNALRSKKPESGRGGNGNLTVSNGLRDKGSDGPKMPIDGVSSMASTCRQA